MILSDRDHEKPEAVEFPFRLRGNLTMALEVEEVSPEGVARMTLAYQDFDFEVFNKIRDREVKVILNREGAQTWEGERLINEVKSDQENFPLRELAEERFLMEIDKQGKIHKMELPSGLSDTIPYLSLKDVLEQAQPAFPEKAILEGESWSREVEASLPGRTRRWGAGKHWSSEINYTFRRSDKKEGKEIYFIEVQGAISQQEEPAGNKEKPKSGVRSFLQDVSGEILFDPVAGEVISSRILLNQKVKVAIEVGKIMNDTGFDIDLDFTLHFDMDRKTIPR